MTAILLKFVHIIAIAGWSVGLLTLPSLYLQRRGLNDDALYRLHNFTRFFYVRLVSPTAFVAIASGIVLIFVQATFEPWFALKLALVGAMVIVHVTSGLMILRLFEPDKVYPWWRFLAVTALTICLVGAILMIVLGKPQWYAANWIKDLFAPGALGELVSNLTAWSR